MRECKNGGTEGVSWAQLDSLVFAPRGPPSQGGQCLVSLSGHPPHTQSRARTQQERLLWRAFHWRRFAVRASNVAFVSPRGGNRGALWALRVAQQQQWKTQRGGRVTRELKDSIQSATKSHLRKGGRNTVLGGGDPSDKYPLMGEPCVQRRNSGGTQMEVFYEHGQPF